MGYRILLGVVVVHMAAGLASVHGQSLLKKSGTSPYDEPVAKAFKKHDHIQIMVVEKSRASTRADFRGDKRSRTEITLDDWLKFKGSVGKGRIRLANSNVDEISPEVNMDARFRQDNIGRTSRQSELQFTVTAEIVDIRPNGTLVIEAKKDRTVNEETEHIKLTGEVAPGSVLNNVVRSEQIANLTISYEGTGSVGDTEKPGILGRIVSWLWPF